MKKALLGLFLVFPVLAFSQNWQQVGSIGFSFQTRNLFVDSTLNLLYCTGGGFSYADSIPVNGCAQSNGISWDSIPIVNPHGAGSILRYNSKLCFSTFSHILTWDGMELDTIGKCTPGAISFMSVFNGELYALGSFDSMNGISASRIAKYDGNVWSALDTTHWGTGTVMACAALFQGDIYVGGNMVRYDGSMNRLARWDGSQWNVVGNDALAGGLGGIGCMAVYNNDLWIGGLFFQSMGNPYDGIARWDGTQWLDPGGGIDFPGQPAALEVYNNELWMFGGFTTVIGIPACVARWNGTDWCTVGDTFYPSGVSDAAVYNNELYICGGFRSINGDTVNFISKWVGGNYSDSCGNTTGVEEPTRAILPLVYPNPASDIVTFQFSGSPESRSIIIYDQLGKEVWREETNESSMIISLQEFAEGIYFYSIINEAGQSTTGKFIVAR